MKRKRPRWKTGGLHWPGSRREHESDMAARLTPLEETEEFHRSPQSDEKKSSMDDTIRVGSKSVHLPEHLVDEERDTEATFRLDFVAVVILAIMLGFIIFVAWQITLMPVR